METRLPKPIQDLANMFGKEIVLVCIWNGYQVFECPQKPKYDPNAFIGSPAEYLLYNVETGDIRFTQGDERCLILRFMRTQAI